MKRMNVIGIDICLIDEETGEYEFKATIDKGFIDCLGIDVDLLKEKIDNLVDSLAECQRIEG